MPEAVSVDPAVAPSDAKADLGLTGGREGQCIQVGAAGEKRKPRKNKGWNRLATSRDKQ